MVAILALIATLVHTPTAFSAEPNSSGWTVETQMYGKDRYETATKVSQASFPKAVGGVVVLATGNDFPDALSAAPLAVKLDAPLLLTPSKRLAESTRAELARLKPSQVIIIGGTGAVSAEVERSVRAAIGSSKTVRIGGSNRYDTSSKIVNYGWGKSGSPRLYVATGRNFPDPLSLGAAAGSHQAPLLLVKATPGSARDAGEKAKRLRASQAFIAGGTVAVNAQVENALKKTASVTRYAGSTRYETAAKVAENEFVNAESAYIATGKDFPDALVGAAAAGKQHVPLVLSQTRCVPLTADRALRNLNVSSVTLVGGPSVLNPKLTPCVTTDIESVACEGGTLAPKNGVVAFADLSSLARINIKPLGQELPTTKEEGSLPVCLSVSVGSDSYESYGTIKVQGTSTARWPKKNWALHWYSDASRTKPVRLAFGDSIPSDTWVAKADWIDPSQLRNPVAYALWGAMVTSRDTSPQLEVANSNGPIHPNATGYPATVTSQIQVDGDHYGISTLTLGHDYVNFNVNPNNPQHLFFEFDARGGGTLEKTWDKFRSTGIDNWFDNYLSDTNAFSAAQKAAIDEVGAVINGSQENFDANFDTYFDKANMIDMLLYIEVLYDWDGRAQDLQVVSYDLKKWYFLPWDKDTTFGLGSTSAGLKPNVERELLMNYVEEDSEERPWFKTYTAYQPEVEARYAQLRDQGIFSTEYLMAVADDIYGKIPRHVWQSEGARWSAWNRPSLGIATYEQLMNWFEIRLHTLDDHFNYGKDGDTNPVVEAIQEEEAAPSLPASPQSGG